MGKTLLPHGGRVIIQMRNNLQKFKTECFETHFLTQHWICFKTDWKGNFYMYVCFLEAIQDVWLEWEEAVFVMLEQPSFNICSGNHLPEVLGWEVKCLPVSFISPVDSARPQGFITSSCLFLMAFLLWQCCLLWWSSAVLTSAMIAPCCRKVATPKAHKDHIHLQVLWIRAERKDFSSQD